LGKYYRKRWLRWSYSSFKIKRIAILQLADLYEVRIALEALAVKLLAQKKVPDALENIGEALQVYERVVNGNDTCAMVDADRAFHMVSLS